MTNFGPKTKKDQLWEDWRLFLAQYKEDCPLLKDEIKTVVDLAHTVHTGLAANFDKEPSDAMVLELTRLVLARWDKAEERKRRDDQEEMDYRHNQAQESLDRYNQNQVGMTMDDL